MSPLILLLTIFSEMMDFKFKFSLMNITTYHELIVNLLHMSFMQVFWLLALLRFFSNWTLKSEAFTRKGKVLIFHFTMSGLNKVRKLVLSQSYTFGKYSFRKYTFVNYALEKYTISHYGPYGKCT